TPKGTDLDAATDYAWMIEGLARERALGSGTAAVSLTATGNQEISEAERFAAGPAVVEDGRIRASFDGTAWSRVKVFGNVDSTWYPLFSFEPQGTERGAVPAVI